jgi:hypothetical protein
LNAQAEGEQQELDKAVSDLHGEIGKSYNTEQITIDRTTYWP